MKGKPAFGLFAYFWALSALFDLIPRVAWFDSGAHTLLACCAVFVLLRPTSLVGFGFFSVVRLAAFLHDSPHTPNHQVLFAVAGATILCAAIPLLWRDRKAAPGTEPLLNHESWLAAFSPLLRALAVSLYLYAVLHKLNWAYFDPSVSCAVNTFGRLAPGWVQALYPDGRPAEYVLIFGSLLAEASLPFLLLFARTRLLGFCAGVFFHSLLGLGYFHFSTGLFGLYCLFIPPSATTHVFARVQAWRSGVAWRERLATPMAVGLIGLALVVAMVVVREVDRPTYRLLRYLWMAGVFAGLAVGVHVPGEWRLWRDSPLGRLRDARLGFVFPILMAFIGLSPYLGMRTAPTFSMFSNLRTEGGISNHLFMPATALHLASYQDDLVQIRATNRRAINRFANQGRLRTFYDLRAEIQRLVREEREAGDLAEGEVLPPIYLRFDRGSRSYTLGDAGENPEIMAEIGWLEGKWMNFRPVPAERQACSW